MIVLPNGLELKVGDKAIVTYPYTLFVSAPLLITIEYIGNYNDYFRFRDSSYVDKIIKYENNSYDWIHNVIDESVILQKPTEDEILEWFLTYS